MPVFKPRRLRYERPRKMEEQQNGKVPQKIKAMVPGMTTVVLDNGDVIAVQAMVNNIVMVPGQKDANGLNVYEFQITYAVGRPDAAAKDGR